jgi:cysteine desulfurase/selenocysteine lyase
MDWNKEFDLDPGVIHLNHAAVAPWPRRTVAAVQAFAEENGREGSRRYLRWLQTETQLRGQLAALLNAPAADDIALVKNTSEALSFVAYGLDWRPGDNVVITDQEFPSNRIVWESLRPRGVEVRVAAVGAAETPEAAIEAQFDGRTRLLSVSSVQYATGLRMDLVRLGASCRRHGVLFCVDAIQSLGALAFDAQAIGADFVAADGHKWMLAPEGLGVFYCRAELREQLALTQFGWHMVENAGDYTATSWRPAASGRRFECGSANMLGIHALAASLSLLAEVGAAPVEAAIAEKTARLVSGLDGLGARIVTPRDPARRAGIVTFVPSDSDAAFRRLNEGGVICAQRGGGIRLSPHFYTPDAAIDRALALLR